MTMDKAVGLNVKLKMLEVGLVGAFENKPYLLFFFSRYCLLIGLPSIIIVSLLETYYFTVELSKYGLEKNQRILSAALIGRLVCSRGMMENEIQVSNEQGV